MRRPGFGVTAFVVTFLCGLAAVARWGKPQIPPRDPNALGGLTSSYLEMGSRQPVRWRTLSADVFRQARRSGRPVLLVIGAPWSSVARQVDDQFFGDRETAAFLNRQFVPVRLDGSESPEWMACLLPISRLKVGLLPDFQMWVLDGRGRTVALVARDDEVTRFDWARIRSRLRDAVLSLSAAKSEPGSAQTADRDLVWNLEPSFLLSFDRYSAWLAEERTADGGLFARSSSYSPTPSVWRYGLLTGALEETGEWMDRVLLSPLFDPVGGGFRHLTGRSGFLRPALDRVTVQNAEAAEALALRAALTGDPLDRRVAELCFDAVSPGMWLDPGLASAAYDATPRGQRSRPASVGDGLLDSLPTLQAEFVRKELSVDVPENTFRLPFLARREALQDTRFEAVRERLLAARPARLLATDRVADVEGFSGARLLEAARLLGDSKRLARAVILAEGTTDFEPDGRVVKKLSRDATPPPSLMTYLSLADARLALFLADGRVVDLDAGRRLLGQALRRFGTNRTGLYRVTPPNEINEIGVADVDVPQIADDVRESASAQLLRLLVQYGRLLNDGELQFLAGSVRSRFAPLVQEGGFGVAGFAAAATGLQDEGTLFTVGPKAVEWANRLRPRQPCRLVAPAVGPVRRDLQKRAAGVYVVQGNEVTGPLSPEQAARRLPVFLNGR